MKYPVAVASGQPGLDAAARAELRRAVQLLEGDRFARQVTALLGRFASGGAQFGARWASRLIPAHALDAAQEAAGIALRVALSAATWKVDRRRWAAPRWWPAATVALTGAAGGAAGLPGTFAELPATTTLLLREIARIAAEEGEDVTDEATRAECLTVFGLGGAGEGGYYAARLALADVVGRTVGRSLGDALPRLVAAVAARFGVPVAWKVAGQAVPVAGAVAGATVNALFMNHFRARARGHFMVRRLERQYGATVVQEAYEVERAALRREPGRKPEK